MNKFLSVDVTKAMEKAIKGVETAMSGHEAAAWADALKNLTIAEGIAFDKQRVILFDKLKPEHPVCSDSTAQKGIQD